MTTTTITTKRFRLTHHAMAERVLADLDRMGIAYSAEPCGIRGLTVTVTGDARQIATADAIRGGGATPLSPCPWCAAAHRTVQTQTACRISEMRSRERGR